MDSLSEIMLCRLKRDSELLCATRNANLPSEFGKAFYDVFSEGVVFSKAHFLCDSMHIDYQVPVAKIEWREDKDTWCLYIPKENSELLSQTWSPYPYLPKSKDLALLIHEIELDAKQVFWS